MNGHGKSYIPDTMWNNNTNQFESMPLEVKAFLADIVCVCKKHGYSLSHEDKHGSFIIDEYKDDNMQWLCSASNNVKE